MVDRDARRLHLARRTLYKNGWDVLATWSQCQCPPNECPLDAYIRECRTTPGALLLALVVGRFEILEEA